MNALKPTDQKAIRLVLDGKVSVTWRSESLRDGVPEAAHGKVEGDHNTYEVSYSPAGRVCGCLAAMNGRDCSHGLALELAVLREADAQLSDA